MTKKIITLLSTALLFCNSLFAQSSGTDTFQLEKNTNGHYIFKTKINHQLMATIFLESGIHVMLIDSLYAFENSRHLNLDFVKTKRYERMNLGGRKYKITHKATGTIQLGEIRNTAAKYLYCQIISRATTWPFPYNASATLTTETIS